MGYIAPIHQYQYQQYQERIRAKEQQSTYRTQQVLPTVKTKVTVPFSSYLQRSQHSNHYYTRKREVQEQRGTYIDSEMTGKGRYFHSYV